MYKNLTPVLVIISLPNISKYNNEPFAKLLSPLWPTLLNKLIDDEYALEFKDFYIPPLLIDAPTQKHTAL